jgi:hypothetical protein
MSTETEKLAIGIEYLDTAATLWIHQISYFSAMHLAGAAEELAGKACRIAGINAHFDDLRLNVKKSLSAVGIEHTEQQLKEAVCGAKNSVKRVVDAHALHIEVDAQPAVER